MDVPNVHLDSFGIADIASAADLPEPCNAWTNHIIFRNILLISRNFFFRDGSWPYKTHITFDDIDKLRQFIKTCLAKEISDFCDAGIVF